MKKITTPLIVILVLFNLIGIALATGAGLQIPQITENPDSLVVLQSIGDYSPAEYFGSLGLLAALVVFLSGFLIKNFNLKGFPAQFGSWIVALILSSAGKLFSLGMFTEISWLYTIIYGFATGLIANGIADVKFVKNILKLFGAKRE